ncbi:MAG: nicotinate-nicotinamide nucleotide adenylyltransferase [Planctomycetota bacterium]|nr:MAG: nicotinate-nicotinamide nucleotide adenylyltransferase [Planctomycetota bacterium]
MRIAIFGGSFDPPHMGHVYAAVHARLHAQVDAVWVFPVAHHPYGKVLSPFSQRLRLAQAAFADFPFVSVREDESDNPQGHTITLIELLQQRHPQHQWLLIGGSDTAADLDNWHRGNELRSIVEVHPIPRRGWDEHDPAALPAISSTMVRERLAMGTSVAHLIPQEVTRLIDQHRWYEDRSSAKLT